MGGDKVRGLTGFPEERQLGCSLLDLVAPPSPSVHDGSAESLSVSICVRSRPAAHVPKSLKEWVPVLAVLAMRGHPGQVPSLLWQNGQEGLSVFSVPLTRMACVRMSLSPSLCP